MRPRNSRSTRIGLTATLAICLPLLVSGCETPSGTSGAPNMCLIDKPIGIAPGDTEETKERITEHDRRLICLCPEQYPELREDMECPER